MPGRSFLLLQLQPEESLAFGPLGSGWPGVYRWCKQSCKRGGGRLSGDSLVFTQYDLLFLHLDADVASKQYSDGSIIPEVQDGALPCQQDCPPPTATTNSMRIVLLSWCGETVAPPKTVICMPSQNTEAWVVSALYPADQVMNLGGECLPNPEARLAQQPKGVRIKKRQADYQAKAPDIAQAWRRIADAAVLGEARRFEEECLTAVGHV